MIEDRLSKKQCLRLAALEKAIESFHARASIGHGDTIVARAKQFEEYLKAKQSES
jgi:hypothetical protein